MVTPLRNVATRTRISRPVSARSSMRGLIDGESWVPWHHFLAVDLYSGKCRWLALPFTCHAERVAKPLVRSTVRSRALGHRR
jgi:hypothetical protein